MKRLTFAACMAWVSVANGEIQPETLGTINTLPDVYPPHWIIAHDASFFHMLDGKFIVLDADAEAPAEQFKGMFNGSFIASFQQATTRPEMYVAETFYSRGWRGERTDVLTFYDKATLAPTGEVILPPKRLSGMPQRFSVTLIDDEKLALVFNLTPATSMSVVDLVERKLLGEIPVPGCALAFPTGQRSFTSLCANGSLYTVEVDENGGVASSSRTDSFFNIDEDALFEKPAMHEGVAYFPTFMGNVFPVDLNGSQPRVGEPWSLVAGTKGGWRPGGIIMAASDSAGRLYTLMHPEGGEGTHKDPGIEVWVFDTDRKRRVQRIELQMPLLNIELTRDEKPLLFGTNVEMGIDVYDARRGDHMRTITNFGQETPLLLHSAR